MNDNVQQTARRKPICIAKRIGLLLMLVFPLSVGYAANQDSLTSAIPRFWTIEAWSQRVSPAPTTPGAMSDPAGIAVRALCQFYGLPFDRQSIIASSPSPLAWPRVFAGMQSDPLFVKTRFEQLAQYNTLAIREIVVLDVKHLADSLMSEVSDDFPVVLNHPEWPVLFGYDTREPDSWWMVYRGGRREILFDSERREDYTYWADNPAANLAWAVTGRDTQRTAHLTMDTEANAYRLLETIHRSVQGDRENGIVPYPLSLRTIRDSLASSTTLPELSKPTVPGDPLGIRRALQARQFVVSQLERLSMQVVDTLESQPLRLALYFYHNSVESFNRLDSLLYGHPHATLPPDRLAEYWSDQTRRTQAVEAMTDILEWEKQAAEQIEVVVTRRSPRR